MVDDFIAAHRYLDGLYVIGGPLSPISIKDQICRGSWLAHRLVETEELVHGESVLIVGAGFGGLSAAVSLVERGCRVTIVESKSLCHVQRFAFHRWIHPHQYDWPWRLWKEPLFVRGLNLKLREKSAAQLTLDWKTGLEPFFVGPLKKREGFEVTQIEPIGSELKVEMRHVDGARTFIETFRLVIWAVGFGEERAVLNGPRTDSPSVRTTPFWEPDQLGYKYCGHYEYGDAEARPVKVFIGGSGDGALQDFIRVVTGEYSAKEAYKALKLDAEELDSKIRARALEIEDVFHRGFQWCSSDEDLASQLYLDRQTRYQDLVRELLADEELARHGMSKLRTDVESVCVLFRPYSLTAFYGLNVFLAVFLAALWELARGDHPLYDQQNLNWAERLPNRRYLVGLTNGNNSSSTEECDILVLRFGINSGPADVRISNDRKVQMVRVRHHLPYAGRESC